jgi:hypothetical protein
MCDYSLHNVKSRPAQVGDSLVTRDFGTGTRGFAAAEDANLAICLRAGTELSFAEPVKWLSRGLFRWRTKVTEHYTAVFRQTNENQHLVHHDALEFPDGQIVLLTLLVEGMQATVLQLPVNPKTVAESQPASATPKKRSSPRNVNQDSAVSSGSNRVARTFLKHIFARNTAFLQGETDHITNP